jgi:drug/metabolite transporter (DMT)-like permease
VILALFVILWSSGYVVGAAAIEVADPAPLLAARFLLASIVLVPAVLHDGRWRGAALGRLAVLGLLLQIVQFGGIYGGFALGVPAALSALVMLGLAPLVTAGLAVGSGQEQGSTRLWTGLGIGVVGVAISLAPELGSAQVGVGVALTVMAMVGLAGGTVLQKRWVGAADPLTSAAVQNVTAAALTLPVVVVVGGRFDVSAQLILCVAWIVGGMAVGTLLLFVHLLKHRAASTVGALLLLVPPVTAIASAITLGQKLHPASLLGMLVAAVGVGAVLQRASARPNGARTTAAARLRARPVAAVRAE